MRNLVLRLGDVAIPVGLCPSVSESEINFRIAHNDPACRAPISTRIYCDIDERSLEPGETMKVWEVAPGQLIELSEDELAALQPTDSSLVEITGFIDAQELDPLLAKKRYHLQPSKGWVGRRPYRALAEAMRELDVVALTRFTAWNSEQLGAVSSRGLQLELATLNFAEDLVDADSIADAIAEVDVPEGEHDLMVEVVSRYTRTLQPADLASQQRPLVRSLLEAKLSGGKIAKVDADDAKPTPEPLPLDLQAALKRTLKAAPRKKRVTAKT